MHSSHVLTFVGNTDSILFLQRVDIIRAQLSQSRLRLIDSGHGNFGRLASYLLKSAGFLLRQIVLPQYLIFHGAYNPILWPALLYGRTKAVSILQGSELTVDFRGVRAKIIKLILTRSTLVVCRNEAQRAEAVRLCGVDPQRCLIVNWGLNQELFDVRRPSADAKIVVISPRATQSEYNIPTIFHAVERLKAKGISLHFIYVKFNSRFEIKDSVVDEFLADPSQSVLWQAIARSDLCVSIPGYDGLSNTLLETLALGTFPVFSDLAPYAFLKDDVRLGRPVELDETVQLNEDRLVAALEGAIDEIDTIRAGVEFRRCYARVRFQAGRGLEELIEALRD